jgi:hypothetical protein
VTPKCGWGYCNSDTPAPMSMIWLECIYTLSTWVKVRQALFEVIDIEEVRIGVKRCKPLRSKRTALPHSALLFKAAPSFVLETDQPSLLRPVLLFQTTPVAGGLQTDRLCLHQSCSSIQPTDSAWDTDRQSRKGEESPGILLMMTAATSAIYDGPLYPLDSRTSRPDPHRRRSSLLLTS